MHYCTCSVTSACSFIVLFLNVLILGNKKSSTSCDFCTVWRCNFVSGCGEKFLRKRFFFWADVGKNAKTAHSVHARWDYWVRSCKKILFENIDKCERYVYTVSQNNLREAWICNFWLKLRNIGKWRVVILEITCIDVSFHPMTRNVIDLCNNILWSELSLSWRVKVNDFENCLYWPENICK